MTGVVDRPGTTSRPPRPRGAGARWASAGVLDQAVVALANAGMTLVALAVISRERSDILLLSTTVTYFAIGINRALVGEVLVALASRYDGSRRDQFIQDALSVALAAGVVGSAVFAVLALVTSQSTGFDVRDLGWLVPFLPLILMHDTGRHAYLADRRPEQALVIDLVWFGTQVLALAAGLALFGGTPGGLLVAWGLGAAAGVTVFLARTRHSVFRGSPRRWVRQTRHLAGWFTAAALVSQVQSLVVASLISAKLPPRALSGFRGAQMAIIQPVQNFQLAVQGLLIPRLSRLAGAAADGDSEATRTFSRQLRTVSTAFTALAAVALLTLWPLAQFVLVRIPKFTDIAPLALPTAIQASIYLIQVPYTASLRGMHRAKMIFGQYVASSTFSITGLVIGADHAGLLGAAWGLTAGATGGLVVQVSLCLIALRQLRQVSGQVSDPRPEATA